MANTFQDFMTKIHSTDLAKPTLFHVIFPQFADLKNMAMLCHEATIPGYTVMSQPFKVYGLAKEMPYELAFDPVKLSFYVDANHSFLKTFNEYREKIIDPINYSPVYRDGGWLLDSVDIEVIQYSPSATPSTRQYGARPTSSDPIVTTRYKLRNAFIKSVNSMNMSWKSQNQILEISIDLAYEYFQVEAGDGEGITYGSQDIQPRPNISALGIGQGSNSINASQLGSFGSFTSNMQIPNLLPSGIDNGYNQFNQFNNLPIISEGINGFQNTLSDIISPTMSDFVDSSGIGSAWSAATSTGSSLWSNVSSYFPVMSPTDMANPINGVRLDPSMITGVFGSGISNITSNLPFNFDTLNALNPSAAAGFVMSRQPTSNPYSSPYSSSYGSQYASSPYSSSYGSNYVAGDSISGTINSITNSVKNIQRNVLGTVGTYLQPLSSIKSSFSGLTSQYASASRAVKNMPKTVTSQFTDFKYTMPIGTNSNTLTPINRSKPKL